MKQTPHLATLVVGAVLLVLILADAAEAYIDPGTGSVIIQVILASLVGIGMAVKIFWQNIKKFFAGVFHLKRDNDDG